MLVAVVYGADRAAANPTSPRVPDACPQGGEPAVPKGLAFLLMAALVAANACGPARPPAARSDVQRGTALPPPGLNASTAVAPR
jgi:hypothetical protein